MMVTQRAWVSAILVIGSSASGRLLVYYVLERGYMYIKCLLLMWNKMRVYYLLYIYALYVSIMNCPMS